MLIWGVVYILSKVGGYKVETRYAHCSALLVSANTQVAAGTIIAKVGDTGWATGPHLHFEIRINGEPVNPRRYLKGLPPSSGVGYGELPDSLKNIFDAAYDFGKPLREVIEKFGEQCQNALTNLRGCFHSRKWYNAIMKQEYLNRKKYATDLTDKQWAEIEPLFVGMREYKYSKRELLNAVLYLIDNGCKWRKIDNGCKWRNLPHDFPAWQTVYSFFRRATENGLWDKILEHLVEVTRKREGRNPNPTYAIIDSQSVKTVYASEQIGFDGGKKQR